MHYSILRVYWTYVKAKKYVQLRYVLPTLNQCIILWFTLSKYDKNIFYSSLHIPQWLTTVFLLGNYIQQKIKTIKSNKNLNAFSPYVISIFLLYNNIKYCRKRSFQDVFSWLNVLLFIRIPMCNLFVVHSNFSGILTWLGWLLICTHKIILARKIFLFFAQTCE